MESEDVNKIVEDILELLEDIRIYGTPQFTRQARMAFIARAFCSSLVDTGWFTKNEIDQFMKSIATVSSSFSLLSPSNSSLTF